MNYAVELFPHGKSFTFFAPGAVVMLVGKAGNRADRSFHEGQYLADGVLFWLFDELVAASFAAGAFDQSAFNHFLNYYL